MKKTTHALALPKLYCDIFGHKYEVTKNVTLHVKEYTCKCCKKQLTTNGKGNLTELTPKYQEINALLEQVYNRRLMRTQQKAYNSAVYNI